MALGVTSSYADDPVQLGELDCKVVSKDKKLFETILELDCTFTSANSSEKTGYEGSVDREGITLGDISSANLSWIVATVGNPDNVKLDGTYLGADAGVSVGAGVGANYLVGGFNKKISLQPVAVENDTGFGLSLAGQKVILKSKP